MYGLFTVTEWKERLATDTGVAAVELVDVELAVALEAAKEAGWADKVQGEPHIFVLPNVPDFQFGFVWSDACTTILSPLALPWMSAPAYMAALTSRQAANVRLTLAQQARMTVFPDEA